MLNTIVLQGRLCGNPELRCTMDNKYVTRFTIASERSGSKDNTDFISCIAWRENAEEICRLYRSGDMVTVIGSLHQRQYMTRNGYKKTEYNIVVSEVHYCSGKHNITGSQLDAIQNPDKHIQMKDFDEVEI